VPAPLPLSPGERRVVKAADCAAFVAENATARVAPRPPNRRKIQEAAHA
jgi:hypothetical protein